MMECNKITAAVVVHSRKISESLPARILRK